MAHKPPSDEKSARLADALRANLRRRKSAGRKAKTASAADETAKPAKDR